MGQKYIIIVITIFAFLFLKQAQSNSFSKKLSPKSLGLKREKLTHLHFYFHDVMSGKSGPSVVKVAQAATSNASKTGFGTTVMTDDPLTTGPEVTSKIVGRAQGIVASADLNEFGYLFVLNFAFVNKEYNGSTLSILGRNAVMSAVREMPIVGGTGAFRFARGYALTNTRSFNVSNGDATFEYDVYVRHY